MRVQPAWLRYPTLGSKRSPLAMRVLTGLSFLLLLVAGPAALGQQGPPAPMSFDLSDHQWTHRLLLVFAPSDGHPDLTEQRQRATGFVEGFRDRDLLFVSVLEEGASRVGDRAMDAASAATVRERFGIEPGAFAVVLVGKDGTEKRRSDRPVPIEDLFAQIDQMPMRQREMRDGNRR